MKPNKNYILWGSSGHAKVLSEAIRLQGDHVIGLFDNDSQAASILPGIPLIGGINEFSDWINFQPNRHKIFSLVAIGGSRGRDRLFLQNFLSHYGLISSPLVHPLACVSDSVVLGEGTQILAFALVAADVRLGSACIVNHKASIDHECQIADGVHVAPGATLCGCVTVEEHAMIGAGTVVLPRLRIGQDSIIGAGSVVTRDVPKRVVVVGNPATVLRDID